MGQPQGLDRKAQDTGQKWQKIKASRHGFLQTPPRYLCHLRLGTGEIRRKEKKTKYIFFKK